MDCENDGDILSSLACREDGEPSIVLCTVNGLQNMKQPRFFSKRRNFFGIMAVFGCYSITYREA